MRKPLFLMLGFAVCLAAGAWLAGRPAWAQNQVEERIRVRVERVPVVFSAFDRKERFVKDLDKSEIEVFDNKRKQEILDFVQETDLPLRIGLLIDVSNSIRDRFKFEQEAAVEFLQSAVRPNQDSAFVVGFDTSAEVAQDFTDDVNHLASAIRGLRPGGGTALYDALYYAIRDKLMDEELPGGVRRTIIVIGDGEDNSSRASREDTLAMAQRGEVTIFAISTNMTGLMQRGDKVLERFAGETGGRVFHPFRATDLTNTFEQISEELRSQYAILYRPTTARDGKFHPIEVVSKRKGVKIRARKGYFADRD